MPRSSPVPPAVHQAAWALARALAADLHTEEEQRAIKLCLDALSYVTGETAYGPGRNKKAAKAIAKAHDALIGGATNTEHERVLKTIDEAVKLGGRIGYPDAAMALADTLALPRVYDRAVLASWLERHIVFRKRGQPPQGRHTTAMIARDLGFVDAAKYASRIGKRRK